MVIKKRLTYATIAFYFLCDGIEYAIIFPTIWEYLQKLGARKETLLGLSVAAYSFSSLIIGPVIGRLYDKTKNAKLILIFMNLFETLGSLMYFAAVSPWFVVLSRFICGVGNSGGAAMIADVTCSAEVESRTAIISNLQACRQFGLLTGPVFNLILRNLDFNIGGFIVNKLTAPGLFMVGLGVILQFMYIGLYFNLAEMQTNDRLTESLKPEYDSGESEINQETVSFHESIEDDFVASLNNELEEQSSQVFKPKVLIVNPVIDVNSDSSNAMIESADDFMDTFSAELLDNNSAADKVSVIEGSSHETEVKFDSSITTIRGSPWKLIELYKAEFLRDEVTAILGLAFVSFFAQTSLETIVTPLSQTYFGFGDFENSMLFLFAGVEILLAFIAINFLSKRLEDRVLILAGGNLMVVSLIWFLATVPWFPIKSWASLPYFAVGIFINLLGISLLIACSVSLYSKVISVDHQGFGHGLRRTMLSCGTILGPLWGGAAVHSPVLLFSVPLAAVAIFLLLFIFSFSRMRVDVHLWRQTSQLRPVQRNETTPLLRKC
ncbi:hypothetical protein CHUAL_000903 [Chamberlinius hualienensis]